MEASNSSFPPTNFIAHTNSPVTRSMTLALSQSSSNSTTQKQLFKPSSNDHTSAPQGVAKKPPRIPKTSNTKKGISIGSTIPNAPTTIPTIPTAPVTTNLPLNDVPANTTAPIIDFGSVQCCSKRCKLQHCQTSLKLCGNGKLKCRNYIHTSCMGINVMEKGKLSFIFSPITGVGITVCSKACYNKVTKALEKNEHAFEAFDPTTRVLWEADGPLGPNDPNTSAKILLDWMTENGGANYRHYRGNDCGEKKIKICKEIADKINAAGICNGRIRTDRQVQEKIRYIDKAFKKAHDFAHTETGAGLRESDPETKYRDALLKKCIYYFDLLPVYEDRACARAKVTSDDIGTTSPFKKKKYTSDYTSTMHNENEVVADVVQYENNQEYDYEYNEYNNEIDEINDEYNDQQPFVVTGPSPLVARKIVQDDVVVDDDDESVNCVGTKQPPQSINILETVDEESVSSSSQKKVPARRPISISSNPISNTSDCTNSNKKRSQIESMMYLFVDQQNEEAAVKHSETQRHNKIAEKATIADIKKKEFELRLLYLEQLEKLQLKYSDEQIVRLFPDLKEIIQLMKQDI
jgi:hypothetical protein